MVYTAGQVCDPDLGPAQGDKLFRDTFENAGVGLAHLQLQGQWLRLNRTLCQMLGYSRAELLALSLPCLLHPEDLETIQNQLQQLGCGIHERLPTETRLFHRRGHVVWVRLLVSLIRDEHGQPDYVLAMLEDISTRKALEAELREHERQHTIMARTLPCGLARLDRQLVFQFVNPAFEGALGRPAHSIVGRHVAEVYPADIVPRVSHHAQRCLSGETVTYQSVFPFPDGQPVHVQVSMTPQRNMLGAVEGVIMVVNDISELIQAQNALHDTVHLMRHLAQHDRLTGLPNRALFHDRLDHALAVARRQQVRLALVFIDLDGFKPVNDALGHQAGDRVLQQVATRIKGSVRESDTVARLGGDEFVLLLPQVDDEEAASLTAHKVRDALQAPMVVGTHQVEIGASIGIALYPDHSHDADALMSKADTAMYEAKRAGKGEVLVYSPGMLPTWNLLPA